MTSQKAAYSPAEEIWSAATHGVGIVASAAMLAVLVTLSAVYGNAWGIVSTSIFGASLVLMYTASTIYHAVQNEGAKKILKKFDHIAIYYLIAGSYTPFLLVAMRSPAAWTVFGIIWTLAILGTFLKIYAGGSGTKRWSVGLYLAMGWLIVFLSGKLFAALPPTAIIFLVLGGLFYTGGVFFYLRKSKRFSHAVWHVFVLLGSFMHFFAVLFSCVFI
jgi:hemolysin III